MSEVAPPLLVIQIQIQVVWGSTVKLWTFNFDLKKLVFLICSSRPCHASHMCQQALWTVNYFTGKDSLERPRGVFKALWCLPKPFYFNLEKPEKPLKICLHTVSFQVFCSLLCHSYQKLCIVHIFVKSQHLLLDLLHLTSFFYIIKRWLLIFF